MSVAADVVDEAEVEEAAAARQAAAERAAAAAAGPTRVVHITRPPAMEEVRRQLPIIGLEQEIMEGINHNDVVVSKIGRSGPFAVHRCYYLRNEVGRAASIAQLTCCTAAVLSLLPWV